MNSLRLKEIREMLDYDVNINRKVLQLTQKTNKWNYRKRISCWWHWSRKIDEASKTIINELLVDLTVVKGEVVTLENRKPGGGATSHYIFYTVMHTIIIKLLLNIIK